MITITDKAAAKLKEFADGEGVALSVRVKVIGSGCAGFAFDLSFDDIVSDTDEVCGDKDVEIITDMMSSQYLEGTEIGYREDTFESGFTFSSSQIKSTCGCGSSYSF